MIWSRGGASGRFHYTLVYPVTFSTFQHSTFSKYNELFLTMFNTRKRREPETWRRTIIEGVCLQTTPKAKVNELCRISISGHQCNLNIDNLHSTFLIVNPSKCGQYYCLSHNSTINSLDHDNQTTLSTPPCHKQTLTRNQPTINHNAIKRTLLTSSLHRPPSTSASRNQRPQNKLSSVNENFTYYEDSNAQLQTLTDDQVHLLERKDAEIARLKTFIATTTTEHEETASENVKLRRQSSTYEKIVEANAQELRSVAGLETTIEDREAEVRQFSIDLAATRTERDDRITEVKGLEGDIVELRQELEDKDQQIEMLLEKLSVVERHISISKDLAVEELDDAMEQHMEKWTAMRDDGSPPGRARKTKRESIGGMNLADEFSALSDGEYNSQDAGYDSEASSIGSVASRRAAARKSKQTLSLSEIEGVDIQPSNKSPPRNLNTEAQTGPATSPKTASTEIQTDTTKSPKKKSLSQVITKGVQTSPIAALIQKFTFSGTGSSGVQTSPVAASPKTLPHQSFSEILSKGVSPVAASPKNTVASKPFEEVLSKGIQTSPVAASPKTTVAPKPFEQVLSKGVQTSPVAASVQEEKAFSEVLSGGVGTSPVAASPEALSELINIGVDTSPVAPFAEEQKPFSEVISGGIETSPVAPSVEKQKPFSEVISSGVQTSPITPSPTKPTSPFKSFAEVLSNGASTSPITPTRETTASSAESPTLSSPSNIPLPPSPAAASPISTKSHTAARSPLSNEITSDQIETSPPVSSTKPSQLNIKRPRVPTKDMSPTTLSHYKIITALSSNPMAAPSTPTVPTNDMDPTTLTQYKSIAAPRPNPMLAPSTPTTTTPPDRKQNLSTLISATLTPLLQDILSTGLYYWPLLLLCFSTVWTASYLGSAAANSAAEWSWAHANGYAPENKYVYVGKSVPGHLGKMVWGLVGLVWNLVFGGWWVGAGSRLPLSPG
jgi:hypothetical protein